MKKIEKENLWEMSPSDKVRFRFQDQATRLVEEAQDYEPGETQLPSSSTIVYSNLHSLLTS